MDNRVSFKPAAPAELMRAVEKDQLYGLMVSEACQDAFHHIAGARSAVEWSDAVRVGGQVLYYALTTGAGRPTLGEEYCDLLQVLQCPLQLTLTM